MTTATDFIVLFRIERVAEDEVRLDAYSGCTPHTIYLKVGADGGLQVRDRRQAYWIVAQGFEDPLRTIAQRVLRREAVEMPVHLRPTPLVCLKAVLDA
jgi:hypothetical protein